MTRGVPILLAVLALAAETAEAQQNAGNPLWSELGNPVIGGPLRGNDPPDFVPPPPAEPSPPLAPEDIDRLRGQLIGKPVFGAGQARIGEVSDLVVGIDHRIANVLVTIGQGGAHMPVPWTWVANQIGNPTLVVPWNPALITWLTQGSQSPASEAAFGPPAPPAERARFEEDSRAELDQWRERIDAQAVSLGERDVRVRQLRLAYGAASDRWERLTQARDQAWDREQMRLQADLEDLRRTWTEVAATQP